MNYRDLQPANNFSNSVGAKSICYGAPGIGKTPIINTAPRPVLLICEPGMLSMRGSVVPSYEGYTPQKIDEFFDWFFGSNEARAFDTLAVDSISQMCEIYLAEAKAGPNRDGRAHYGIMAEKVMKHVNRMFFIKNHHCYLICKQQTIDIGGIVKHRPYFPGKDLNVQIPHLYDMTLHLSEVTISGFGVQKAFRTKASFDIHARDRSGKLSEFEPADLNYIFRKATT